jgi:serine/threonine-protein kinase HipA
MLEALTEFDYLSAVDDFSRVGGLRLQTDQGDYLAADHNKRKTPPLLELEKIQLHGR